MSKQLKAAASPEPCECFVACQPGQAGAQHGLGLMHSIWPIFEPKPISGRITAAALFALSLLMRLSQAYTGPTAVFIDEFDARSFECSSNDLKSCATRLTRAGLQLMHGDDSNACIGCKILLAPSKESARSPTLCWSNHLPRMA